MGPFGPLVRWLYHRVFDEQQNYEACSEDEQATDSEKDFDKHKELREMLLTIFKLSRTTTALYGLYKILIRHTKNKESETRK